MFSGGTVPKIGNFGHSREAQNRCVIPLYVPTLTDIFSVRFQKKIKKEKKDGKCGVTSINYQKMIRKRFLITLWLFFRHSPAGLQERPLTNLFQIEAQSQLKTEQSQKSTFLKTRKTD